MKHFTIFLNRIRKKWVSALAAGLFWLAVWQVLYIAAGQDILLVSPVQTAARLFSLARSLSFWQSVLQTCRRVLFGFLAGVLTGSLLAAACACSGIFRALTAPFMRIIRTAPVASFSLLALVWVAADRIPSLIAFLVVVPVVWENLVTGLASVDRKLLEMASLFRFSRGKVLRYIYFPAEAPHFIAACSTGLGFAWKSAVAAEIISLPRLSVGRQLNNAKIYLETADLFAWTAVVILLSLLLERLTLSLVRRLARMFGSAGDPHRTRKE